MKTMMQNKLKKLAALFLIAVMCFGIAVPYLAAPEDDTIYISSVEDLIKLSKNCSYDKWSEGKTVVLSNDISLKDTEFTFIPYFAGTFDGQGYTISDFELGGSYEPAGLFGTTSHTALICNLKVTGSVIPSDCKEVVGGIVGINGGKLQNVSFSGVVSGEVAVGGIVGLNKATGVIEDAFAQGSIFGEHGTGGIAGRNLGTLTNSRNEAFVNNTSVDSTISLDDINTNLLQSLYTMNSSDMVNAFTDSGGIAGYSSGKLILCSNEGTIGYPRVGYNAGGIVGRNCGYVQACTNEGEVLGRKDIGGIVGQIEPFFDVEIEITDLVTLDSQLHTLKNQIDTTIDVAESSSQEVSTHLGNINDKYVTVAIDEVEALLLDAQERMEELKNLEEGELPDDAEIPDHIENPEEDIDESSARESIENLIDALEDINNELSLANDAFLEGSAEVSDGLKAINHQLDLVSDTIITMVDKAKNFTADDVISDTSTQNVEDVIYGKVTTCINKGVVEGDMNVGGIAGIMSVEYEIDPEDDTSMDISWEERKQYEVKAIVMDCINKGEVTAKKDNAAGICGLADIGYITNCFAYGSISSESGDYVGGIAGVLNTTLTNCIANCGLSGNSYVGGIIGCGYTDEEEGGSSVSDCYSLVKISDCEQFEGAIAGCKEGTFSNNYFVSKDLQGINRVSYEGVAQPITYEELLQVPNLPEELKGFTLTFVAEDKVIKSIDFHYGDSFGEDVFPEVPEKNGYDGVWDITDLSDLCFDTVVTAEYTLYVTAIQSQGLRENSRPAFFVEGDFSAEDTLTLTAIEITEQLIDEFKMSGEIVEAWQVSFSDDGHKRHNVRFLPPEGMENAKLYVREDGEWTRVETTEIGSYRSFQVVGNEFELAVVSRSGEIVFLIGAVVLLIILLVAIILLEKKKHVFSGLVKKIHKALGVKKLVIILILAGAAIGVLLISYVAMMPKVRISAELAALSEDLITADNQSMKLDLTADIRSNHIELNSNIYIVEQDDSTVFVLEENGKAIYLDGKAIYLENGKAFRSGDDGEDSTSLLETVRELFNSTEITRTNELEKTIYSITAKGDDAKELLAILVPSTEGQLVSAGDTQIRIIATNGILESVEIEGSANIKDSMETAIEVSATIYDFTELEDGEYEIPQAVIEAMKETDRTSLSVMVEEMYRLLLAWIEFSGKEQTGTVSLDVECGPINVETEWDWTDISNGLDDISNSENLEKMPDMIYNICMNGDYSCQKLGSSYIFTMTLDKEAMTSLSETIAPEIARQTVDLTEGELEVVVENNEIMSFAIVMEGTVTVLLSDVDASVEAEFIFK